jgi:hypothetical protein
MVNRGVVFIFEPPENMENSRSGVVQESAPNNSTPSSLNVCKHLVQQRQNDHEINEDTTHEPFIIKRKRQC